MTRWTFAIFTSSVKEELDDLDKDDDEIGDYLFKWSPNVIFNDIEARV